MTAAPVTDRPDLAAQLEEAQRAEQPLREEVERLELQLANSATDGAFDEAHKAQQELPGARERHAIAAAQVASLAAAVTRIKEAQAADERTVALAKQREQARRDYELARAREAEQDAATDECLAACRAGLAAIRASYAEAVGHSQAADEARAEGHRCLVLIEGIEYPPVAPRRRAQSALADQVLETVIRNSAW